MARATLHKIKSCTPCKSQARGWEHIFPDQDPGSLVVVLSEKNLLESAEITDMQVKQRVR